MHDGKFGSMCVRPPLGKVFRDVVTSWSGAVMCPGPVSAAHEAAGPDEVRRSSPIQAIALIVRCSPLIGFIRSRLDRSSSHPVAPHQSRFTRPRRPFPHAARILDSSSRVNRAHTVLAILLANAVAAIL